MDNGRQTKVKMSGYLYKKCKKRMLSSWKMYWFVLEDRLLLYYRSKDEYQAISPCKGSINLGPPCNIKSCPSIVNAFQIETRTNTFTLKAETNEDQIKWMQTIISALHLNPNFSTEAPKKLNHFRYSLNDLIPEREPNDRPLSSHLERQNTMPERLPLPSRESSEIIQRLQKMGAHSYGGSLGAISKIVTKKCSSPTLPPEKRSTSQNSLKLYEIVDEENILREKRVQDNIYERISGDSNCSQLSNRDTFVVDNENYSVPIRRSSVKSQSNTKSILVENDQYLTSDEVIYSEPKLSDVTDHNKNSVLRDNCLYATSDVNPRKEENLYEDVDHIYSTVNVRNVETSSQSSDEAKNKTTPNKELVKEKSIKKSKSFIKRVWKKRNKRKEEPKSKEQEDEIYEEVDQKVDKMDYNNESTLQMLSELQNILENKKTKLKLTTSTNSASDDPSDQDKQNQPSTSSAEVCPALPPKTHKKQIHDSPNQPINTEQSYRSLDEILEDLDKEKVESTTPKNKVKLLIEKFSESESEDVVLRKRNKPDFKLTRHSDELNRLLDELAKVTSAPVLTPGVTSSLVTTNNLSDEEWLKLLPVRQRRMSEPDYDIPRPHKSIQISVKRENPEANDAIPVTRFFGPALPPAITDNSPKEESLYPSMTPDSLEVEEEQKSPTHCSYTSHSYYQLKTANEHVKNIKRFSHDYNKEDDKIIYAMPKSYFSVATHIVNTCQNICSAQLADECTIIYKNVKNVEVQDEIFNDSLEVYNNEKASEF